MFLNKETYLKGYHVPHPDTPSSIRKKQLSGTTVDVPEF